jgi:hypothetical protein
MDIEEFYDADPRRRASEEIEFGRDWSDASGTRVEVSYVIDTGELYSMQEPNAPIYMDPVGDTIEADLPVESLGVVILATVPTEAEVDALLDGWQQAMAGKNSIEWVRSRVGSS